MRLHPSNLDARYLLAVYATFLTTAKVKGMRRARFWAWKVPDGSWHVADEWLPEKTIVSSFEEARSWARKRKEEKP